MPKPVSNKKLNPNSNRDSSQQSNQKSKVCPRCQASFECKVGSIQQCQCSSIYLSDIEQEYVNTRYDDCLCVGCLVEVQSECSIFNHDKKTQMPLRH